MVLYGGRKSAYRACVQHGRASLGVACRACKASGLRILLFILCIWLRAGAQQAFRDYTELSISRRFEFSDTPLDEFPLTLPHTRIVHTEARLQMRQDATVGPKSDQAVSFLRSLGKVPTWSSATTPLVTVPPPAGAAELKWSCATTPLVTVPPPAVE